MDEQQNGSGESQFINRFKYAFHGLNYFFRIEGNAIIHTLAALTAIGMGVYFGIDKASWLAIIIAIILVFSAEIFNTAIEMLCDHISPEWNEKIKMVKDLAAGAVLVAAVGSMVIGLIVFLPYILK